MAVTKKKSSKKKISGNKQSTATAQAAGERIIQEGQSTLDEALAIFDSLPVAKLEFMFGRWKGSGVDTDHAMDGLLENYAWYGKEFIDPDNVHPLLFSKDNGKLYKINPALMPMGMTLSQPWLKKPFMRFFFALGRPVLSTKKTTARLRMTEHRGKVSATMCYDALPIHDVFRKVNENTVLGLMDYKKMQDPFFFALQRV